MTLALPGPASALTPPLHPTNPPPLALLGSLDPATLARLQPRLSTLRLEPGGRLYATHKQGTAAYALRSGILRLERSSHDGGRCIVRLAGPGDLVGLEALLGQPYRADARACGDLEVCRLSRPLVEELCAQHAGLQRELMRQWQHALDEVEDWRVELARGSARERMLRLLLKLSEYTDDLGLIWMPGRQEIGDMLGITLETASRLVSACRQDGLLELVGVRRARLALEPLLQALRAASLGEGGGRRRCWA